ncbi:uncharacterized protein LOC113381243 [Ctenocephalides felis]|uniref:uncharacterized protein LOC113381243 n=1 Tax=Ctenocephalides felis TaxID=7515 RepID=UPI000E6E16ED|nr:uncharacterized protein LOC113381243 [Ctenocephalides felis]
MLLFYRLAEAFDRVNLSMLMEILKSINVDWRDRRLIQKDTNSVEIGRGVRQGCCMSPIYSTCTENGSSTRHLRGQEIFRLEEKKNHHHELRDDLVVISKNQTKLQNMMNRIVEVGRRYGMEINIDKSKVMRITKKNNLLRITVEKTRIGRRGSLQIPG